MNDTTRQAIGELVAARQERAFHRLRHDPEYIDLVSQQDKTALMVEEYYQRFEKFDRIAIRRHYEGEKYKESLELDETYLQGLRDCFRLCAFFLGVQKI